MPTYKLTKRVQIRKPLPLTDFEFVTSEDDLVCDAWAEITALTASERVNAQQLYAGGTHRIILRWPGMEIESLMRVVDEGTGTYEILGVIDLEGQYLEITATKAQTVGTKTTR